MKLVTVEDLKVGDILAKDVLLEDFTVLLSKGTVIKEEYINKLRDLSIVTVYIEDNKEQASRISLQEITILKDDVEVKIKNKVKEILELHVYQQTEGLQEIAKTAQNIISDILEEEVTIRTHLLPELYAALIKSQTCSKAALSVVPCKSRTASTLNSSRLKRFANAPSICEKSSLATLFPLFRISKVTVTSLSFLILISFGSISSVWQFVRIRLTPLTASCQTSLSAIDFNLGSFRQ